MRPLFIIIALQLLGLTIFGQELSTKRNALYLSGDWMTKNISASLSYERLILISRNGQFQVGSSLGYGRWYTVDSKGSNYNLNLHFMVGMSNTRGEFTLGLRCKDNEGHYFYPEPPEEPVQSTNRQLSYFPNLSIGFRYQKPGGHLLIKSAIGIPFLQVSLGYQF